MASCSHSRVYCYGWHHGIFAGCTSLAASSTPIVNISAGFTKKPDDIFEIVLNAQVMNSAITAQGRGHPWWVGFVFGCLGGESTMQGHCANNI